MPVLPKDIKLLTLSLILRTMPKPQQRLLISHFSPEVVKRLAEIEEQTGSDVEKLDWTPFYQTWPELQKILSECKKEVDNQKLINFADAQRPAIREYLLIKSGKQKKGKPVILSQEIMKIIDRTLADLGKQ
ncbi:MAG: hypothetical protein A3B68_06955 [Candidatus Melainabacteria bacterium RIFCSPHIGHO2_02_FULL_34_12]|nr:MAG: hypothetical protein A3B68_06955 [Candidatus Melainabacteria bacterium RIFCSPHIGHO2_02_FULL_34_12]